MSLVLRIVASRLESGKQLQQVNLSVGSRPSEYSAEVIIASALSHISLAFATA